MKSLIKSVSLALALIVPVASFAQSNAAVTRAQVRAELVQLEKSGYRVGDSDNTRYPEAIQAAEAKIAIQQRAAANSGYGGVTSGSSDAGQSMVSKSDWNEMYNHP